MKVAGKDNENLGHNRKEGKKKKKAGKVETRGQSLVPKRNPARIGKTKRIQTTTEITTGVGRVRTSTQHEGHLHRKKKAWGRGERLFQGLRQRPEGNQTQRKGRRK